MELRLFFPCGESWEVAHEAKIRADKQTKEKILKTFMEPLREKWNSYLLKR
jgi:hypothetical protein